MTNLLKTIGLTACVAGSIAAASSTLPSVQARRIPLQCSAQAINRGATAPNPARAVRKAVRLWNELSQQRGYYKLASAKNARVQVVPYPNGNGQWKANAIGNPCRFPVINLP